MVQSFNCVMGRVSHISVQIHSRGQIVSSRRIKQGISMVLGYVDLPPMFFGGSKWM